MKKYMLLLLLTISCSLHSQSAQWRGPQRNGIYPDKELLKIWPEEGPELLFMVKGIGSGYSSAVEHEGIIYVTGKKDSLDYLSAINQKGEIIWQRAYGTAWNKTYADSRCTPTVEEERVYVLSGMGELVCLHARTGEEIWKVNVDEVFEAEYHLFGQVESPLIVDDLVISTPCGKKTTMVAFNKYSGALVWQSRSLNARRSYASPILHEHEGIRLILGMTSKDLIAVDPDSGTILWTYPYYLKTVEKGMDEIGINMTNTPLVFKDEIFLTSGYNCPAVMLKLASDGTSVSEKWVNPTLDNHHHGVVLLQGFIYGSNFYNNRFGKWVCVNWDNGEVMYVSPWKTKGSLVAADNLLYAYEEKSGHVGLIRPNPEGLEVISSFQVTEGEGPHWAHPSIYGGKLLIRHGDVLQAYLLTTKSMTMTSFR
jgi:outer membrane protein assembly factor BamB